MHMICPLAAPVVRTSCRMWLSPVVARLNFSTIGCRKTARATANGVMMTSHACVCGSSLNIQRRPSSALSRLLQDSSDPYLLPIRELNLQRIAEIALENKKDLQHLWDGLAAINATFRMLVEDMAATKQDLDAAFAVYTEVMCYAPTATATTASVGSEEEVSSKSLPADVWRAEWEEPLQEFRTIFRATGDSRLP